MKPGPFGLPVETSTVFPEVETYLIQRVAEFSEMEAARKIPLRKLADFVSRCVASQQPARFIFVCTHNSRRSHLAQIWAAVAAQYYGVPGVETYSGGTEVTALHPQSVASLLRAGLKITPLTESSNPQYAVRFTESLPPLICFSKIYNSQPNPSQDFCAVMMCTQADQGCPVIAGCLQRTALPVDDPKIADGTPEESQSYDACSRQICREMLYVFSQGKSDIAN